MNTDRMNTDRMNINKYIEFCEKNIIAAPENFASSVMDKINAVKTVKTVKAIPFISRKMRAAVCFSSAFAIMTFTFTGLNNKMLDFLSTIALSENIGKISEFLDIFSKFNLH